MLARLGTSTALALATVALIAPAASAGAPQVKDTWAAAVGAASADIHATVNPGESATVARVEYLTAAAYEENVAASPPRDGFTGATSSPVAGTALGAGGTDVEFSRRLSFLKASTAYRYRVAATNADGTSFGPARAFTTIETAPVFSLPDGRGWELVSPVDKNGGEIQGPGESFGGGVLQAAAAGGAVTYSSRFSFGAAPQGAPPASQYVSRRGGAGWETENITTPTSAGVYGAEPDGVPFQLFSPDLARALVFDPQPCTVAPCPRRYLLRTGAATPLPSPATTDLAFVGADPSLSQAVFAAAGNIYRWSGGSLSAINLLPGDATSSPGAELAAPAGAVSVDGARIYFKHGGDLYLRQGGQTVQVDAAQGGGGNFEAASSDGTVAFFTASGHLYRYAAGSGLATDLTPGGEVQGVLGASPDGGYLYYLTPAGLFLARGGITTKVAVAADTSNYPPATGTARVAADGTLAFLSAAILTGYDNNGFAEVYRYAPASGALTCVSCNPSGARPLGPSTIPGAVANGTGPTATRAYKPRVLTASGDRLFFNSDDALAVQDTNNDRDVYQWEAQGTGTCVSPGGCVALISSGRATGGATFLDASADGGDAFFLTDGSLVANDPGAVDVYDARVGGGFPVPEPPIPCLGDACQPIPGPPEDPGPGTAFFKSEANPPLTYPKAKRGKSKKHRKKNAGRKQAGKKKAGGKQRKGGHR